MESDGEVAVGVSDDPPCGQRGRRQPGLFLELASGCVDGSFARVDLPARELPQPSEQTSGGSSLDEPSPAALHDCDGRSHMGTSAAGSADRNGSRVGKFGPGTAAKTYRTFRTGGSDRAADRFAEFHHRLVERSRGVERKQIGEHSLQPIPDRPGPNVSRFPGPASCDPQAVRLEGHDRYVVHEARQGASDVRTDPGEFLPPGDGGREPTALDTDQVAGRLAEVSSSGVVARSLPNLQDARFRRAGEVVDRRERFEESLVVGDRLGDPGLLEKDFRHPGAVRVSVEAPGEGSPVAPEPRQ